MGMNGNNKGSLSTPRGALVYHILKLSGHDTDFRPTMLDAIQRIPTVSKAKISLASGFFTQNQSNTSSRPAFKVSDFPDGTSNRTFISAVLNSGAEVECYGAYPGSKEFKLFVDKLRAQGITATGYYKRKFHCKLFAIEIDGEPVFEIIGSSNMTKAAYAGIIGNYNPPKSSPNCECDLVLVSENGPYADFKPKAEYGRVMALRYEPDDNNGIPLTKQMYDILGVLDDIKANGRRI